MAPPSAYLLAKLAQQAQVIQTEPWPVPGPETPMRNLCRRLTPEVRQTIVSRYVSGESAKALSQDFEISRDGVRRILKDAGVTIRSKNVVTPQAAERIVQLYEGGLTIRDVAAQAGCAYGTVRGVLHENDADVRVSSVGRRTASDE